MSNLLFLILLILIGIILYIGLRKDNNSSSTNANTALLNSAILGGILGGSLGNQLDSTLNNTLNNPNISDRPDNLDIQQSPFLMTKTGGKISQGYDEYDDTDMLVEKNDSVLKDIDNIVIDGNNFIYALKDYKTDKSMLSIEKYTKYIKDMLNIFTDLFPRKKLFVIMKDPETKIQLEEMHRYNNRGIGKVDKLSESRITYKQLQTICKIYFESILRDYPKVCFVVAYGTESYRDDYAAIWTADILDNGTNNSLLLSRDRYRDVSEMKTNDIRMVVYGKSAAMINKKINKPFTYVTKGAVKNNLTGYTFSKKQRSGFYEKLVGKKSQASDLVLVIGV